MAEWRCESLGAGALVDLITVQQLKAAATKNSFGETLQSDNAQWETFTTAWAEIHPTGGEETPQPTQQVAVRRWQLRVRHNPETAAISTLMRVVLPEGEILPITRVSDPNRMRRWIEIDMKEAPADGS